MIERTRRSVITPRRTPWSRGMRRTGVAGLLTLVVVGATFAAAGPATADRWTHADAAGDVSQTTLEDDGSITSSPLAEDRPPGDIVRVVARHRATKVTIRIDTRAVVRGPLYSAAMIRTRDHAFFLSWMRLPGWHETDLIDLRSPSAEPAVRCPGLRRTLSRDRTAIRFAIPRSCLDHPRWVRVATHLSTYDLAGEKIYGDDGLEVGEPDLRPSLSPRIRR